ncbi:MAG: hypothetical protein FWE57_00005, partial [Chitinispirillia bacterium]|nr:hypothetical protein [Chitinispirillia bacterium]
RNPTAGGTVSPASQVNVNPEVPIVNITAEPASGYRFVDWTVVSGTATFDNANDASTTVTLGSNATIRANFQTFTLTVNRNPTAGGTVSPASQVNVNPEIPIVNITATSASGHRFVNWTVVTGTATFGNAESASTTVTLSSNATIRANFKISHLNPNISYGFFTDPRDNQRYHTIVIGNQRWFAENLNFSGSGGVCYDNNPSNCDTYGRLYTWAEAMNLSSSCNNNSCASQVQSNHQGACPVGWRVPSDADWTTLANFVGSAVLVPDFFAVGTRLKSRTGWEGFGNVNGTDEFGFSALPGGYRFHNGTTFVSGGSMGLWWSSVESSPATYALGRTMHSVSGSMNSLRDLKNLSISLRCIEN